MPLQIAYSILFDEVSSNTNSIVGSRWLKHATSNGYRRTEKIAPFTLVSHTYLALGLSGGKQKNTFFGDADGK